jgi:hypothetical protein
MTEDLDILWDEAQFTGPHNLNTGLIALLAFNPERNPKLIGSGFIVEARGVTAVALTAAHNLEPGILRVQNPNPRHVTSTPDIFAALRSLTT